MKLIKLFDTKAKEKEINSFIRKHNGKLLSVNPIVIEYEDPIDSLFTRDKYRIQYSKAPRRIFLEFPDGTVTNFSFTWLARKEGDTKVIFPYKDSCCEIDFRSWDYAKFIYNKENQYISCIQIGFDKFYLKHAYTDSQIDTLKSARDIYILNIEKQIKSRKEKGFLFLEKKDRDKISLILDRETSDFIEHIKDNLFDFAEHSEDTACIEECMQRLCFPKIDSNFLYLLNSLQDKTAEDLLIKLARDIHKEADEYKFVDSWLDFPIDFPDSTQQLETKGIIPEYGDIKKGLPKDTEISEALRTFLEEKENNNEIN